MFSRRQYSGVGRGGTRYYTQEQPRDSDYYRSQLIQSIHRSRTLYQAIVENIRVENELLSSAMPWVERTPASATPNNAPEINGHPFRGPAGVQRNRAQQNNPFQDMFVDITNMLFNNANSPEANRGLSNEQISVAVRDCRYGELPTEIRERYTTCPVTLDQFDESMDVGVIRVCGHVFRRDAIVNWLSTRSTCPTCRRNVSEPVVERAGADNGEQAVQNGVTSTHGLAGVQFVNPTVRRTVGPNQQVSLEFDGVVGVPSVVGGNDAQQQHIVSILERMFSLPDLTGGATQQPEEQMWGNSGTSLEGLGEIVRHYASDSEHEPDHDDQPD